MPLGGLLEASWGSKCQFVFPLLDPSWGHLAALLGRLGLSENPKEGKAKIYQKRLKINDFGLFEPSWRTSWRPLWGLLGCLGLS